MASPILSVMEIREYLSDKPELNYLLDREEFSPTQISLAMDLAVSEFNLIPPLSGLTTSSFPNKALLMSGTLYKLFQGACALLARNTLSYSDGGIAVPVEEHFPLYQSLAAMFQTDFQNAARSYKTQKNYEAGWGGINSDYGAFPLW